MRFSASTAPPGVVSIGGGVGLPAMRNGIGEAFSPRRAIATADLIVLGPGRVYTSLLPLLLVREIAEEIGRSRARVVLVMNLMTEPGETDGYVASDCVLTIRRHAPEVPVHDVLLNNAPIPGNLVVRYALRGALPMAYDTQALEALGCRPLACDLLRDGPVVRHDPWKLWSALLRLRLIASRRPLEMESPSSGAGD